MLKLVKLHRKEKKKKSCAFICSFFNQLTMYFSSLQNRQAWINKEELTEHNLSQRHCVCINPDAWWHRELYFSMLGWGVQDIAVIYWYLTSVDQWGYSGFAKASCRGQAFSSSQLGYGWTKQCQGEHQALTLWATPWHNMGDKMLQQALKSG